MAERTSSGLTLRFVMTVPGVIIATVITSPHDTGMSLVIIVLGVPVYWLWRRWQQRAVA